MTEQRTKRLTIFERLIASVPVDRMAALHTYTPVEVITYTELAAREAEAARQQQQDEYDRTMAEFSAEFGEQKWTGWNGGETSQSALIGGIRLRAYQDDGGFRASYCIARAHHRHIVKSSRLYGDMDAAKRAALRAVYLRWKKGGSCTLQFMARDAAAHDPKSWWNKGPATVEARSEAQTTPLEDQYTLPGREWRAA